MKPDSPAQPLPPPPLAHPRPVLPPPLPLTDTRTAGVSAQASRPLHRPRAVACSIPYRKRSNLADGEFQDCGTNPPALPARAPAPHPDPDPATRAAHTRVNASRTHAGHGFGEAETVESVPGNSYRENHNLR